MRQLKPWEDEIPQQQTMRRKYRASGRMRCALEERWQKRLEMELWDQENNHKRKETKGREKFKNKKSGQECQMLQRHQISLGVKSVLSFSIRRSLMT